MDDFQRGAAVENSIGHKFWSQQQESLNLGFLRGLVWSLSKSVGTSQAPLTVTQIAEDVSCAAWW